MSTPTSRRQKILEWFLAHLQTITVRNGFRTDAGERIYLNEIPELGPDDPDVAIALTAEPDETSVNLMHVVIRLPLKIHAIAKVTLDDPVQPWIAAEQVLSDVKEAIEQTDRTLGGLVLNRIERDQTETLPRVAGSLTVGVTIGYIAPYKERWGNPAL